MFTEQSCKTFWTANLNTSNSYGIFKNFSSSALLEKIKGSWLFDEEILLLIKQNLHEEALKKYVDNEKYAKAEEFCITKDKSLGLLTTLLTIYFKYYE